MAEIFTLNEAAKRLGVKAHVLTYALITGKVREPHRVGGRRMFTPADMTRLSKFFGPSGGEPAGRGTDVR